MADRGRGIDPGKAGRLFDTFYTTKGSGLGFGLSIVRSIIESHNGSVSAEDNAEGGAIFRFNLPAFE